MWSQETQKTAEAGTRGGLDAVPIHSDSKYSAKERERHATAIGGAVA
jgi:hypothetical protein